MLVFVVPFLVFSLFRTGKKPIYKIITACVLVLVLAGLIFSFTRAAWLGGIIALIIIILYLFKVKLRYILSVGILFFVLFFAFQEQIIVALKKNSQDSSQNFIEHVQSMSNISTDASNLERINRWQSAIRMFKERPLVGWGPGTYQFVYSPFQRSQEKTIISTNAGDGGNAHSEYLGTLSEQGIIGLIIIVILYITMIYTANKVFWKSKNKFDRYMSLTCMLALVTYFVHGFLNNFLDIDKAAVLFWLYVAIIVSLDLKYRNEHKKLSENSKSDSE
jgi:putative inorganic carbon (HCO3(-)) transporter